MSLQSNPKPIPHSSVLSKKTLMADIWDYFKALFKKAEASSPSNPMIHEMIKRTEEEKADFQFWKETLVAKRLKSWLHEQYILFDLAPQQLDEALDFLDTPSSKGFVVYFNKTRYSKREVTHFFDYLKEKVLSLNYRTQISDLRSYEKEHWVESIQRHYLKPRNTPIPEGKLDQKYGNVMIELTLRNDQVLNLKFRATAYQDRMFETALPFSDLMKTMFL